MILPLQSKAQRSIEELRGWLEQQGDAQAIVVIVKCADDTYDVSWSRQELADLAYAGRRLEQEIRWLMDGRTALDGSETGA